MRRISVLGGVLPFLLFVGVCARAAEPAHGTPAAPRPLTDGATPLAQQAKHIFDQKCKTCHSYDDPDGDPDGAFGHDGMPLPEKVPALLNRIGRDTNAHGHMPPKDEDQLTDAEKTIIRNWAAAAQPSSPPAPACQSVEVGQLGDAPAGSVSDAEGKALLQKACVMCHGQIQMQPPPSFLGSLGRLAFPIYGIYANTRDLGHDLAQLIKAPHTRFLNNDGSFNAQAMADGRETVGRVLNQVAGVDGHAFMPPHQVPARMLGGYNDADRTKLISWLRQQTSGDLPPGCQTFTLNSGMSFSLAQSFCGSKGARLPNIDQLTKLQDQFKSQLGDGCVWSASFSNNPSFPHQTWEYDSHFTSAPWVATDSASCRVICVR